MIKYIKKYAWCWFLGIGTQMISGYTIFNLQWYAFCFPLIVLIGIKDYDKDNSSNI
jgi:hypothetical protein